LLAFACLHAGDRGRTRREPMDTLGRRLGRRVTATPTKRVRGGRAKSRQGCRERALEGRNPREHPAVDVLNPRPVARDSREGQSPETVARRGRPSASVAGLPAGGTVGGCVRSGNGRMPSGRRKLRRVNPKSAAGAKQNRRGSKGVSRHEGDQTLKAEPSGQAKLAKRGPSIP
jgi:hypothetical protein